MLGANLSLVGQRNKGISPSSISNLTLWYDANYGVYTGVDGASQVPSANNDPVRVWTDLSANGNFGVQTSLGSKPLYKTAQFGAKPALSFDGVDDRLDIGPINMSGDITVFVLIKTAAIGSPYALWGNRFASNSADQTMLLQITSGANPQFALANSAGTFNQFATAASNLSANTAYVLTAQRTYAAGTAQVGINGTYGTLLTGLTFPTRTSHLSSLGRDNITNAYPGLVAELIIYDRALTLNERRVVERYLGAKYAVTVA